ncbi:MAG: orotidine-5'-phosphate decarboxylase, partial [Treponema sp.]|nr:orotidine-5'-phosphate decarboxylase [Treponema sp.]
MDKLFEAVADRGHVCVGLDTAADYIPPGERQRASSDAAAVLAFNRSLVDATIDAAACFKVQIACYEEMGLAGLETYARTLKYIREKNGLVIADIKRGDIADTALRYAKAHFEGDFEADFVTLSPYMGMDSVEPWLS